MNATTLLRLPVLALGLACLLTTSSASAQKHSARPAKPAARPAKPAKRAPKPAAKPAPKAAPKHAPASTAGEKATKPEPSAATTPPTASATTTPPTASAAHQVVERESRIEFDERMVKGQSAAGAIYLFQRSPSEFKSIVQVPGSFRPRTVAVLVTSSTSSKGSP